jgi:hypothetical protein
MAVDYERLAKQYGGAAAPSVDYDALANKFGGASTPAKSETNYDDIAKQFGGALVPPTPTPAAPPQAAAPEEEKSSLWEFPKALVRGAYDLKGMYAGLQQRGAALGMETPQAAMDVFNKIDAGEIKSKADLSKLIGEERRLPTAEEMVEGDSRLGAKVRTFNLARDYLNATPEERKTLRAQMQSDIQQGGKDLASAVALGEQVKKEAAPYEARVKSLFDIENFADAMSYLGSTSGQAIPQMVPMVGAAVLTRGKAAAPAAVGAGMELGAGTLNRVDFISDKIKDEADPNKRIDKIGKYIQDTSDVTVTAAIMNGALDAVLGPEKDIAKAIAAQSLKDMTRKEIAKQIPKAVAKSGAQEFFTGGMQEVVQINAERTLGEQTGDAFTKENIKRVVDSAMAEAIGGATVTTGFEAGRAAFAKKDVSQLDTPEGRALRDLDTLAEEEERVAGPRRPADLTPQEVSNIERRLYAELGRAPNDYEFEEAVDDYLDEQNAGGGVEPGAGIAGVPSTGVAEAAGVPDTTISTAPESGRLDTTGGAAEVAGVREGVQPGALEAPKAEPIHIADRIYEASRTSEAGVELRSLFNTLADEFDGDELLGRFDAYVDNLSPEAQTLYRELKAEEVITEEPKAEPTYIADQKKRIEEIANSSVAAAIEDIELGTYSSPDLAYLEHLDNLVTTLREEGITDTDSELYAQSIFEDLVKKAIPKAEEVITEVTEAEAPASVESIAASYADKLFEANPDYDVADFDKAESDLFSDLIDKGITGTESRKLATKAFEERLNALEEQRGESEGGAFKSIAPTPATYISPAVGIVPVNKAGINRLNKLYSDGKISAQEYADGMIKLYEELEDRAARKSMTQGMGRKRGLGAVIQALEDAANKGRISQETAEFAKWLLLQNPAIAADLAISIKMPQTAFARESFEGVAGFYNDLARIVRIITRKGGDNKYLATSSDVGVHEILHHMERMLPTDLRALIREEWKVRVQKAMDQAVKDNNQEVIKYLALVINGNAAQSSGALQEAENMIKEGKVPLSYYGFINTSEFWAVNGTNILAGRFEAKTGLQKLRQYVKEFIEKIKSIFGLETDDPLIRGLNAVLKGDGTFLQKRMLADSRGGQYSPSLSPEGWATAETEISEDEKKLIEQFRRAGDLQPDVVRSILNNDLNGALNILANRLGGFYGELATKLASLNLQTSIAFDNGADVANRAILATVGPQLQRITSYIRIADPDLYKNRFEGFDKPENLVNTSIGLTVLRTQNKHPAIALEIEDAYQTYKKYMMVATAPGAYLNMFDTITLNTKLIEGIGNRVFLHEVVHAATVSILRADPSQLTKEQLAAREEIEKLYKLAQRNLKVGEYGLTNKFEFLAELFTNDDFRKLLKVIPYPPASTNVLSRFFNAILRLVGADNLASRAMVEAEKLFTSARYQETKPMGPLFAQAPKKRRIRGPISTPDTYRTAETQQNTLNQTLKDAYEGRMSWADAIKVLGPSMWDAGNTILRKTTLPVLNLTQLEDLTRNKFTQISGALKIVREMVAYRAKKMNSASEIMRDWTKAQKENFAQSQLMGRIMMEATIRGIDPDKAAAGALNKPLQDAWNTLKPEFKAIYRRVRDFYANSVNEMVREAERRASAIQDRVERDKALQKIKEQFGPDKLVKPYFPLRRFGQYYYQVGSGNFKEFYEFESPLARDMAMRRRAQELMKGNKQQRDLARTMTKGNGISELYGRNISTTQALKDVQDLVDNITATDTADLKDQLKDSLNQLIYILLPQQSVRKMFINRKAIQGASADMLRVFATTAVHSAYQQSRFMYSEKFLQNLNNARSEIDDAQKTGMLSADNAAVYRDFVLEVEQRVPTIMSNEDTSMTAQIAGKASELTFYYMLSAPFTAMLNTIGAVQLAMPYIGGSYGYARANALLTKNMGRYLGTTPTRTFVPLSTGDFAQVNFPSIAEGGKLPPLLQKAADRFIEDGVVDISLTNDIFELGERPSALYTGTSATVKKAMSGLFHQSERMNREIVLLTTFELAYDKFLKDYQRQPGMEGLLGVYLRDAQNRKIKNTPDQAFDLAIEEATRVASSSLGDYSRQTKGRIFANPIMNLLLKFKQYPILAMYAILRNFHVGMVAPFKKAELNQYRELLEKELQGDPNKDQIIKQRLEEVEAQRKALQKEGRRRLAGILGVTTILGGVAASPFFSLVVGNLIKMFADDDDDEYFDWENWFYNYMETEFGGYAGAMLANAGIKPETAEKAGRKVGEAVARGVPAAMGAALADRVSLDPKALLWRDGRYSPDARENFIESLIANAGPVVGLGLNFVDAYQLVKEGQYARAVEKAVPAIIAKPASAMRMATEGATTKKGDVLIDDFTATELAMQSIGLQPERLAQKQKAAIAMKQKEQKILDERSAIMDRLWMERDNPEGYEAAVERAVEFNSKRKDPKMIITPKKIRESFEKRAKLKSEAEVVGAKIDKRLRSELRDMGGFAEDE